MDNTETQMYIKGLEKNIINNMISIKNLCRYEPKEDDYFTLSSGHKTPFYFDMRKLFSHSRTLGNISELAVSKINNIVRTKKKYYPDYICGLPYGGIPLASIIAHEFHSKFKTFKPCMKNIIMRKEIKKHGTKNLIEGDIDEDLKEKSVLIIDDVLTTGGSVLEGIKKFKEAGFTIYGVIVILDRRSTMPKETLNFNCELELLYLGAIVNFNLLFSELKKTKSKFNLKDEKDVKKQILDKEQIIDKEELVDSKDKSNIYELNRSKSLSSIELKNKINKININIKEIRNDIIKKEKRIFLNLKNDTPVDNHYKIIKNRYSRLLHKLRFTENKKGRKLLSNVLCKKSNLVVSLDLSTTDEILEMAHKLAPHVVMFKLHTDTITNFNSIFIEELTRICKLYNVFLMEDRKYADIPKVVWDQYNSSTYKVSEWCDFITVHLIGGEELLDLMELKYKEGFNINMFLVLEMSSQKKASMLDEYVNESQEVSLSKECVAGFITQNCTSNFSINMTPGINIKKNTDGMGQYYRTPEDCPNTDLFIVGRGIVKADDPVKTCLEYKERCW